MGLCLVADGMGGHNAGEVASDMAAEAIVNRDRMLHSLLRTTCVATMVDGGHARNALPQRVEANVNCRIFPGTTPAQVQAKLTELIGDPGIEIRMARSWTCGSAKT